MVSEISVVLAEDNAALRGLLDAFLRVRHDLVVLGVCSDGLSAVELALDTHADVALPSALRAVTKKMSRRPRSSVVSLYCLDVAPAIMAQLATCELQRIHW